MRHNRNSSRLRPGVGSGGWCGSRCVHGSLDNPEDIIRECNTRGWDRRRRCHATPAGFVGEFIADKFGPGPAAFLAQNKIRLPAKVQKFH